MLFSDARYRRKPAGLRNFTRYFLPHPQTREHLLDHIRLLHQPLARRLLATVKLVVGGNCTRLAVYTPESIDQRDSFPQRINLLPRSPQLFCLHHRLADQGARWVTIATSFQRDVVCRCRPQATAYRTKQPLHVARASSSLDEIIRVRHFRYKGRRLAR